MVRADPPPSTAEQDRPDTLARGGDEVPQGSAADQVARRLSLQIRLVPWDGALLALALGATLLVCLEVLFLRLPTSDLMLQGINLAAALLWALLVLLWLAERAPQTPPRRRWVLTTGASVGAIASLALALVPPNREILLLTLLLGLGGVAAIGLFLLANPRNRGPLPLAVGLGVVLLTLLATRLSVLPSGLAVFSLLCGAALGGWGLLTVICPRAGQRLQLVYLPALMAMSIIGALSLRAILQPQGSSLQGQWSDLGASLLTGSGGVLVSVLLVTAPMLAAGSVVALVRSLIRDWRVDRVISDGFSLYRDGELEAALERFEVALALGPDHPIARTCKGDVLSRMGRFDDAMSEYNRVLFLDPEFTPAISGKGSALRRLGDDHRSKVLHQKVLWDDPGSVVAWQNAGNVHYTAGDPDLAVFCYKRALELDPVDTGVWYNLAVVFLNRGDQEQATAAFGRLTALHEAEARRKELEIVDRGPRLVTRVVSLPLEIFKESVADRVFTTIAYEPGIALQKLTQALGLSPPTVLRAIGQLRRRGMVHSQREGDEILIFPTEARLLEMEVTALEGGSARTTKVRLLTDTQRAILALLGTGALELQQVSEQLRLPAAVCAYHLHALVSGGHVLAREGTGSNETANPPMRYHVR